MTDLVGASERRVNGSGHFSLYAWSLSVNETTVT